MKKHNMDIDKLLDELIDLSDTKYSQIKVGLDTLNTDVLFITKFEELKSVLDVETLDDIDLQSIPKIRNLQEVIKKINEIQDKVDNRNLRMKSAADAYKKK